MCHHTGANGYYRRASDYITHFMEQKRYVFTDPVDPIAFIFKINIQRSRNWIEEGNFDDALGAMKSALSIANGIFRLHVPAIGPPPGGVNGRTGKGAFRKSPAYLSSILHLSPI